MNIAFYIDEMNLRGVANSNYLYAFYNEKILKNKSIIFYNNANKSNQRKVINKFKDKFKTIGIRKFLKIDDYKKKYNLKYIYVQKGGEKDKWNSLKIKTLVHAAYPQSLGQIHGHKYAYVSEWLSKKFSKTKIPFVPYIVEVNKSKIDLKKKLKIKKKDLVFGCHGGETSFDLKFTHDALIELVNKRNDVIFLFLNISKFCDHPRIIFLKGTNDEIYKKKFINTCDAMIYGRSLGESFGLACGEFALQGKRLITYKYNRHRNHVFSLGYNNRLEYSSKKELLNILYNFSKNKKKYFKNNKYLDCTAEKVMKKFNDVFFKTSYKIEISFLDYCINYFEFLYMMYKYLRHKFYNHYYNFFISKN